MSSSTNTPVKLFSNNISLAKIVMYLRRRHLRGDIFPLTVTEILEETNLSELSPLVKNWLEFNALPNNAKIESVDEGTKFMYKPPYNIKNGKSFMNLIKRHDLRNLGGVLLDDVLESLPNATKCIKKYENELTVITRPSDKRKVLYFNDHVERLGVDEDIRKLWHSVNVTDASENSIEQYLSERYFNPMKGCNPQPKVKAKKKRPPTVVRDNEHVANILQTYDRFV